MYTNRDSARKIFEACEAGKAWNDTFSLQKLGWG